MRISDWSSDVCSSDLKRVTVNSLCPVALTESFQSALDQGLAEVAPSPIPRMGDLDKDIVPRSEEHTSELQSLMRISYAVFCLKNKNTQNTTKNIQHRTSPIKHHLNSTQHTIKQNKHK